MQTAIFVLRRIGLIVRKHLSKLEKVWYFHFLQVYRTIGMDYYYYCYHHHHRRHHKSSSYTLYFINTLYVSEKGKLQVDRLFLNIFMPTCKMYVNTTHQLLLWIRPAWSCYSRSLSAGDNGRTLSLEERSDRNDVSALGTYGNRPMSWNSSQLSIATRTRPAVSWLLGECSSTAGRKVLRAIWMQCPNSWSRFG